MSDDRTLFLCDCEGSMSLDAKRLVSLLGETRCRFGSSFCMGEASRVREALDAGESVTVACGQEAAFFAEVAEESGGTLESVDIRDRAGWSDESDDSTPKIAALLAAAEVEAPPVGSLSLSSDGVCLVYGSGATAMKAAEDLSGRLAVTLMLSDAGDALPPTRRRFPILAGRVRSVEGSIGKFEVLADGIAELVPGGRGGLAFGDPRDGGRSECDLILDLSEGAPLLSVHDRRDGYLHADPADPAAVAKAMYTLSGLVGRFEKPLYVTFDESLCAHSRSGKVGCTRCLDVCPASAITPSGDTVSIDPAVCAGCGACASVCPSGAADYALPGANTYRQRLETLISAYEKAGGAGPRILLHSEGEGLSLIAAAARFGRGLPADVLPLELNEPTQVNHADLLAALAAGARQVTLLMQERVRRRGEANGIDSQIALTRAMLEGLGQPTERVLLIETDNPDTLSEALYAEAPPPAEIRRVSPMGDRRAVARLALDALAEGASSVPEALPLPEGAPYGQVQINADACTLCLACAGQCPTGALRDNPDSPELRFDEDACVQCGICTSTCPESALTLVPRYLLGEARNQVATLKRDEPFHCISCGKPFGSKGSIDRIVEKIGGQHWMFPDDERTKMLQMCADCRVQAQYHQENSPFRMGERSRVRTTEDYLAGRIDDDDGTSINGDGTRANDNNPRANGDGQES